MSSRRSSPTDSLSYLDGVYCIGSDLLVDAVAVFVVCIMQWWSLLPLNLVLPSTTLQHATMGDSFDSIDSIDSPHCTCFSMISNQEKGRQTRSTDLEYEHDCKAAQHKE
jgi:hypothetical protein